MIIILPNFASMFEVTRAEINNNARKLELKIIRVYLNLLATFDTNTRKAKNCVLIKQLYVSGEVRDFSFIKSKQSNGVVFSSDEDKSVLTQLDNI